MRPLDLRSWHLLAASGLALAACQDPADDAGADDDYSYDGYDGFYYQCYEWTDCGLGSLCVDNDCETAPDANECVYESLVEIPLPELEPALAITFANLDGEGGDELVGIGASGVSVVLADDSVVLTPWPETHDYQWVTALEIQGDESLDLVVGFPTGMLVLGGMGDGTFVHLTTHESLPEMGVALALDPEGDGIDQLVATRSLSSPIWFTDVATGVWEPVIEPASSLALSNLLGPDESPPEILADLDCGLKIFDSTDFEEHGELGYGTPDRRCVWHATVLDGIGSALISVTTNATQTRTQLSLFGYPELVGTSAMVEDMQVTASTLVDLQGGTAEPVLALGSDTSLALVWDWAQFPEPCLDHLEGAAEMFVAGDRDGDGRQELAVVHEGAIRLLTP